LSSEHLTTFAEAFADSFYQNIFREEEVKSHQLKPGNQTPPYAHSNAFNALASDQATRTPADFRAKAFSLVPQFPSSQAEDFVQSPSVRSSSQLCDVGDSKADVRSLLLEPDMEDLTAIIPN